MTSSRFANSVRNRSAGGQDEHPWLVYSSTSTGPAKTGTEDNAQMQDVQTIPIKCLMANRPINIPDRDAIHDQAIFSHVPEQVQ